MNSKTVLNKFFSKIPVIVSLIIVFIICSSAKTKTTFNDNSEIKVGIVMYHSILNSESKAGKYVITPELFESDLKYLKENGFSAIYVSELIDYVKYGAELPSKPVIISFDDGYYNNLSYAYPLLEKYDMKAEISVIGKYTELYSNTDEKPNNNYSHLTWDDLKKISDRFEILNHSFDMHSSESRKGLRKLPGEDKSSYKRNISNDIAKLQDLLKEKLRIDCRCFTYPYGYISETAEEVIKELGFEASLSCYEHINVINHDENCLYNLGRYNRAYGKNSVDFFSAFDY